jgi:multicomponent Na+:H+ antiporter subunit D
MSVLVPLPMVLCLFGAGLSLGLHRWLHLQRLVSVTVLTGCLVSSCVVLGRVVSDGPVAVRIGAWSPTVGITYVADNLSALMLVVSLVTTWCVLVFGIAQRNTDERWSIFHPVFLVLVAGVSASFLTADLFHLFVAFEVMLAASYVLLTLGGERPQLRAGMSYTVINFLASTVLLAAIGLVYAATGTVNMALIAERIGDIPPGLHDALVLLLLVVFGVKAALFPLFFWLPDAYPSAPSAVGAIFAGLLTKVGIYCIIRTQTLFVDRDGPSPLLLWMAGLTMVIGILGAVAQDDMKRILSFHIVSQVGYMLFGLAIWTPLGIAAAIFFTLHQIPVKTALFLSAGMVEDATGSASIHRLQGIARTTPWAAVVFVPAALSLAGLPPFSGFVGKLALVRAGFGAELWAITGVSLAVSLFTLFSMTKIWGGIFWGPIETPGAVTVNPKLMTSAAVVLVLVTFAVAVAARPLLDWSTDAAAQLLDRSVYVDAVLRP